jgi:hypothetical protein
MTIEKLIAMLKQNVCAWAEQDKDCDKCTEYLDHENETQELCRADSKKYEMIIREINKINVPPVQGKGEVSGNEKIK